MNIKFAIHFFLLLFLSLFLKAQTFVNINDTAYLFLQGHKHGQIQWQQSNDTLNWSDMSGATVNNYSFVPVSSAYFRAKVNSGTCNTIYSEIVKINLICFQCGDTLVDSRDGQKYPTVLIGTQCWLAKNLNVGEKIDNSSLSYQTDNGIIEKFCYNNDVSNCNFYGGLYTWNEMMEYETTESCQGICPSGWHVPSDQEWIELEVALGMDIATAMLANTWRGTDQGTQLKAGGASGYEALLAGSAVPGGYFNVINQYEYMYSSTISGGNAWRRCIRAGDPTVGRWDSFPQSYGFSVRCVKN